MTMTAPGSTSLPATPHATHTSRLYLIRAVVALVWAGLLVAALSSSGSLTPQESIPAFAIALLIIYPLIDVIATLLDVRSGRRDVPKSATAQLINAAISTAATVGMAIAASHGADAVLRVFGTWALLTGIIQLILAIIRRRNTTGQLPMIISGTISTVAGAAFIGMAGQNKLKLLNLAGYAAAGAVFFLISAWRLGSQG